MNFRIFITLHIAIGLLFNPISSILPENVTTEQIVEACNHQQSMEKKSDCCSHNSQESNSQDCEDDSDCTLLQCHTTLSIQIVTVLNHFDFKPTFDETNNKTNTNYFSSNSHYPLFSIWHPPRTA